MIPSIHGGPHLSSSRLWSLQATIKFLAPLLWTRFGYWVFPKKLDAYISFFLFFDFTHSMLFDYVQVPLFYAQVFKFWSTFWVGPQDQANFS